MIFPIPYKLAVALDIFWAFMFIVTKDHHYLNLFLVNIILLVACQFFQDRY